MKVNSFNTLAERINRAHVYQLFGVPQNASSIGIDFIDHKRKIAIELKGVSIPNLKNREEGKFKIGVHQINYPQQFPGYQYFWIFMSFELQKPISDLNPETIKQAIGARELWLFEWDYIHTFTAFEENIPSEIKKYKSVYELLDIPNPYAIKNERKRDTPVLTLFEEYQEIKKELIVPQHTLYIRQDRKSRITTKANSIIFCNAKHVQPLLEAYSSGPYTPKKENNTELRLL